MAVQAHLEAIPGLEVLATLYTILPFQVLEENLYCLCQLLGTLDKLWFVTPLHQSLSPSLCDLFLLFSFCFLGRHLSLDLSSPGDHLNSLCKYSPTFLRVSLCSPGCPGIPFVDQSGLEPTEIHLPLSPGLGIKGATVPCYHLPFQKLCIDVLPTYVCVPQVCLAPEDARRGCWIP